ncbi:MAG: hypothetical protein ACOYKM_14770 [Caulobacterales bacterium]
MTISAVSKAEYRALYARAFEEFGAVALWNKARLAEPSPEHALVIARALRIDGNRAARALAEEIERAARAAL